MLVAEQVNPITITAFYKFVELNEDVLPGVRAELERFSEENHIRGLVVLGREGINSTIAGPQLSIATFKLFVTKLLGVSEIEFKDSHSERMPFARFKVDVRPEIITTKDETLSAEDSAGTHLTARQWHEMLANESDVVLVDTRNFYETEIGMFDKAIDPKIAKFSDFQDYLEKAGLPKDKKLLMYCTGGIRCEKAVPEVKRLGYKNVFQLEGGILKYLEEFPDGYFKGECFVFDHRVAVDQHLQPSKTYKLCPHCGNPASTHISCSNCKTEAVVCEGCLKREDRQACSKNCSYHIRRRSGA